MIGRFYGRISGRLVNETNPSPTKMTNHAQRICDMALDLMDATKMVKNPATGNAMEMRIGCYSSSVVAGVVGLKIPRYVL